MNKALSRLFYPMLICLYSFNLPTVMALTENSFTALNKPENSSTDKTKPQAKQPEKPLWEKLWDEIERNFHRERLQGSTKGAFCTIFPNSNSNLSWGKRPMFIWQGDVQRIDIFPLDSETALWSFEPIDKQQQNVFYSGPELQNGMEYSYRATYKAVDKEKLFLDTVDIPFKVIDTREYDRINSELKSIDRSNSQLNSNEKKLKRALFFSEKDLLWDAARETFSLSSVSSNWANRVQNIRIQFCK